MSTLHVLTSREGHHIKGVMGCPPRARQRKESKEEEVQEEEEEEVQRRRRSE